MEASDTGTRTREWSDFPPGRNPSIRSISESLTAGSSNPRTSPATGPTSRSVASFSPSWCGWALP